MSTPTFALLCPGQGSQSEGMAKELLETFPWTKQVFEEASDAISLDVKKLCAEADAATLQLTENGQPAILTTSYAWFEVLRREFDFCPQVGAGHSLGEYSALLCAGATTLGEAVRLVRERGERMQGAVPVGKGKMAAVIGLEDAQVEALCDRVSTSESLVVAVNYNAPNQVVIAGHSEAVDKAQKLTAETEDPAIKAKKFIPLNVSAPFHSPLMSPVVEAFGPSLEGVSWGDLKFSIVFNVDAEKRAQADIPALLKKQIDHPVRWSTSMKKMLEESPSAFVELGPGKVLAGLLKRADRKAKSICVESVGGLKAFETYLKENK